MDKSEESHKWLHLSTSTQFDTGVGNGRSLLSSDHALAGNEKLQLTNLSIFVESLVEQFSRMLQKNPKEQKKTYRAICSKLEELSLVKASYRLEELASLRSHYSSAILTTHQSSSVRSPIIETSRYATEFEEISWIESGGFGDVFRARNKLDQQEYAIKKIKVKYKDATPFLRTLAEVKTLARLHHMNIVQYKSAWFEVAAVAPEMPSSKTQGSSEFSDDIVFERNSGELSETRSDDGSSSKSGHALCRFQAPHPPQPQPGAELYVCMELCNETLRDWLDRRNEANKELDVRAALSIAHQAAAGICHIHSSLITHHDIKDFLSDLTNLRVEKRPSAREVLDRLTKFGMEFSGSCVEGVATGDDEKDVLIKQLKQQLAEKDDEIQQLHKSLDLIKINPETP